jgi:hypothetical protein
MLDAHAEHARRVHALGVKNNNASIWKSNLLAEVETAGAFRVRSIADLAQPNLLAARVSP